MGTNRPEPEVITEYNQTLKIMREIYHNTTELTSFIDTNEPRLVDEQISAYNNIMTSIDTNAGGLFFLDAPGGTGKTFIINLILAKVR